MISNADKQRLEEIRQYAEDWQAYANLEQITFLLRLIDDLSEQIDPGIEGQRMRFAAKVSDLTARLVKAEKALQMLIDDSFDSEESRNLARQTLAEIRSKAEKSASMRSDDFGHDCDALLRAESAALQVVADDLAKALKIIEVMKRLSIVCKISEENFKRIEKVDRDTLQKIIIHCHRVAEDCDNRADKIAGGVIAREPNNNTNPPHEDDEAW